MEEIANPGNTPISTDELADLIPNLASQAELNEWERENILQAARWALDKKSWNSKGIATEPFVRELHGRMFSETWKWAGRYRQSEKNIGVLVHEIQERLGELLGDVRFWIDHQTYTVDEIAVRFHHRLVFIHPFPNGNGRHARLIADILVSKLGGKIFSWGSAEITEISSVRTRYLTALREADKEDYTALLKFARS